MNSKLLIFVFVVIGFGSIDSSIIKHELVDESFVKIDGFNHLDIANYQQDGSDRKSSLDNIKELTFNKSKTVDTGDRIVPELICNNSLKYQLCTMGNGKYQSALVKCTNVNYGTGESAGFICKHTGHQVTNKNLQIAIQMISCKQSVHDDESAKGNCIYQYSYRPLPGFTEGDDEKNE